MNATATQSLSDFAVEVRDELFRFFKRRVDCPETAADLTQETFLRLHDGERYAATDNLRAVAFHIAGNLAIDHSRRTRIREKYSPLQHEEGADIDTAICPRAGPEREVTAFQSMERIQLALERMSDAERTILRLALVDQLSYAEISAQTAIPLRTVAKRLAHGLKQCRACLAD